MHFGALAVVKLEAEALVNGGCNYNGPKVA
jgi:hypothetical protein